MPGDGRVRTCGDCNKRVYNLAAMTRAQAEALIAFREAPCVRLYRRRDGTVVTADCAPPLRKIGRRVIAGAFAALAGGCVDDATGADDETASAEDVPFDVVPDDHVASELADGDSFTLMLGGTVGAKFIIPDDVEVDDGDLRSLFPPPDSNADRGDGGPRFELSGSFSMGAVRELEFTRSDTTEPTEYVPPDPDSIESESTEE